MGPGRPAKMLLMMLPEDVARARIAAHDHGVLATVHAERGVDAVPVAYALDDDRLGVPVDLVKPKSSPRLQRERNLRADPRATLLVERWDADDWSQLWWARAVVRWEADPSPGSVAALEDRLATRYVQYRDRPFAAVLVFRVLAVTGWTATDPDRR